MTNIATISEISAKSKKIIIVGGCWKWIGYINNKGYGCLTYRRKNYKAHRWFFELFNGSIEAGLDIDHMCSNRSCVRPSHLQAITHRDNVLKSKNTLAGKQIRQTHCIRGHEFITKIVKGKTRRDCNACARSRYHERRNAS